MCDANFCSSHLLFHVAANLGRRECSVHCDTDIGCGSIRVSGVRNRSKSKDFSAVLGTMGGILVAGLIVLFAQQHLHFSGLENAISADIVEATRTPPFDFVQILLAGMLMGVLGVAVDGAIEVASSMEEIRKANPNMPTWRLIASGLNVGTDILGTMVNTLVFAYLVWSCSWLSQLQHRIWTSSNRQPWQLLSIGVVSAEIVRLLAGTLGLVLAIPITAIICAFWNPKQKV